MSTWELLPAPEPVRHALTEEQAAVVEDTGRIVVTVGGPGTGKTLTLVEAVVARINQGVPLERLPVLASSRARAQEIRRQITQRLDRAQISPRVTTVHGFALGLLRDEPDLGFRLLRAPEQELRLRELIDGLPSDFWPEEYRRAATTRVFARQLREFLARARQRGLDPDQIASLETGQPLMASVGRFAEEYLTVADFEETLDYAELIHRARLLMTQPSAAASVTSRFDVVFADDVQEQDPAQAAFLGDLAIAGLPLRAFADPQQRTSAFRGATADGLAALEELPGARRVVLTQGFRMAAAVVDGIAALRSRLSARSAPPLPAPTTGVTGRVDVQVMDDPGQELAHVAAQVRSAHHREGLAWHEMAVIVRTGRAQLLPVTRALTSFGIPVEVSGDELPIAEQHAVQVLLAALRITAADRPLTAAETTDLLAGPLCGLDSTARRRLARRLIARHPGATSVEMLIRILEEPALLEGTEVPEAGRVVTVAGVLREARRLVSDGARVGEILWQLWSGTSWSAQLQGAALEGSRSAHHQVDAVLQLFELAERRGNLAGAAGVATFIGEVTGESITADTAREVNLGGRGVRIVTAHRARDGQWRKVWIVGLQEGVWPRGRPAEALIDPHWLEGSGADLRTHLADERRLFYVACSRAQEHLTLTASTSPDPDAPLTSRFIQEVGVVPQRVSGTPSVRLTAAELVADLRRHAADETAPPELRRAAALRLARLSQDPAFSAADPATWWGNSPASAEASPSQEVITISGSMVEGLLRCPRQWFLTGRARAGAPSQVGASVGEVVHAILARADEFDLDVDAMKAHLDRVWPELDFPTAWLSASEREQMEQALERFATWRAGNANRLLAVEQDFETELEVAGRRVRLKGAVDRIEEVDGALRVVDYKSGRTAPTKKDVEVNPQLGIYQLAASLGAFDALLPESRRVAPASLLMLRHGNVEPLERVQPSIDEATEGTHGPTWVHDLLHEAVTIIDSGHYEARAGRYCERCPLRHSCPAQVQVEVDF